MPVVHRTWTLTWVHKSLTRELLAPQCAQANDISYQLQATDERRIRELEVTVAHLEQSQVAPTANASTSEAQLHASVLIAEIQAAAINATGPMARLAVKNFPMFSGAKDKLVDWLRAVESYANSFNLTMAGR